MRDPTAGVQWSGTQWTFGALINNIWSFAGSAGRPAVNQMELEPEINYTFKRQSESLPQLFADHHGELGSERRRALDGAGVLRARPAVHGRPPIRHPAGTAYYNVVAPAGSGNWTLELLVQLLFPK